MFRWKGIISLAVITGLFFVLSLFLTDRWIEGRLENIAESIVGARVEIDHLNLSLSELIVSWSRMQVADPQHTMKNMIETGDCEFDLEFWPILSGKIIIEDFRLSDLHTNTERETDGALPETDEPQITEPGFISKTMDNLSQKVSSAVDLPLSDIQQSVNVDSIMKLLDIRSIKKIDSLKNQLEDKYNSWKTKLSETNIEKDVKILEQKINSIDVNNIKTLAQLQATLSNINEIKTSIEKLTKEMESTKTSLLDDMNQAKNTIGQVDSWIADDYSRALSKARLPDLSVENIGRMLFGKQVINHLNQYLGYIAKAREYSTWLDSDKPEKESPPRLKGQDILFRKENARPDFWIKRLDLSGKTEGGLDLKGTGSNLVSEQKLIGKSTHFEIKGGAEQKASLAFKGQLNYLGDQPAETFELAYFGFSLANTRLSDSPLLPEQISEGSGNIRVSLKLKGEWIESTIHFTGQKIRFEFASQKDKKNTVEKLIHETIRNTNTITFTTKISGLKDDLKLSINSNLDKILADNLKASVSREIEKAKSEIKRNIENQVEKHRAELMSLVKKREGELLDQFKGYEQQVNNELNKADAKKKEIDKRIEKEKSKLGDQLKDLFK